MLGYFSCFFLSSMTFFKIALTKCQAVWIQIRTDVMLVLIWVQTVAKVISRRQKLSLAKKELKVQDDKMTSFPSNAYN